MLQFSNPIVGVSGTVAVEFPEAQEVTITAGSTVDIGNTPAVTIQSGSVEATISGTVAVEFPAAQEVTIESGTVSIEGTVTVDASGTVAVSSIAETVSTTVTNSVSVETAAGSSVTVAGEVSIGNTPAVTIESGSVEATISGTPAVTIESGTVQANITGTPTIALEAGSEIEITNSTLDVVGAGGFVLPGQVMNLLTESNVSIAAGNTGTTAQLSVTGFSSLDVSFGGVVNSSAAAGAAFCMLVTFEWADSNSDLTSTDAMYIWVQSAMTTEVSLPCKGALVTLTMKNTGSTGTVTINKLSVNGSFRTVPRMVFSSNLTEIAAATMGGVNFTGASPSGMTLADGWIGTLTTTIDETASPVTQAFLLNQYAGVAYGQWSLGTTVLTKEATIVDLGLVNIGSVVSGIGQPGVIQQFQNALNLPLTPFPVNMPASPCALIVEGSSSGNSGITLSLLGMP